jgi:hypothetical protein
MKIPIRCLIILFCLLITSTSFAVNIPWPKIDKALTDWQGAREMLLLSTAEAPLETVAVQEVLEQVLQHGFAVRTASESTAGGSGLILELRESKESSIAILRRSADSAIIAFERHPLSTLQAVALPADPTPPTVVAAHPIAAPVPAAPIVVAETRKVSNLPGPVPLPGNPRSLAFLAETADQSLDLAVQNDAGVARYRLQNNVLQPLGTYTLENKAMRGLYLESGDPDGDGNTELAAVWAEDLKGIYEGTDSQLRSTILESDQSGFTASNGPHAFVRLIGKRGLLQSRGTYEVWDGPVLPLFSTTHGWEANNKAVPWARSNLFDITPLDKTTALQWTADQQLRLVSLDNGLPLPGGTLLYDLGEYVGPRIAVPLETPEYRSGFSKEDVVRETWATLPPRIAIAADGTAYTIRRERSMGLPLVGKPSGQDHIVALHWNGQQLIVTEPCDGIEAFILDFALIEHQGQVKSVLLLLNKKPDGSGDAYLQLVSVANNGV